MKVSHPGRGWLQGILLLFLANLALGYAGAPPAQAQSYSISGRVTSSTGAGIPGVRLTRSGSGSGTALTVTTNPAGGYLLSNLPAGTYSITADLAGFAFALNPRHGVTVDAVTGDATGVDFTGTALGHTISGRVANTSGVGVPRVRVTRGGGATATSTDWVLTNAQGNYVLPNVAGSASGTPYAITPARANTTFANADATAPPQRVVVQSSSVANVNFTAYFAISGRVIDTAGQPVAGLGLKLRASGSTTVLATAQTNTSGSFQFAKVGAGRYTVTPVATSAYASFAPASQSAVVGTASVTLAGFQAPAPVVTISGRVTDSAGTGVPNVRLTRRGGVTSPGSVLTNSSGYYTLPGVIGSSTGTVYTLTPTRAGCTMSPPARSVTVRTTNLAGLNFTAYDWHLGLYLSSSWWRSRRDYGGDWLLDINVAEVTNRHQTRPTGTLKLEMWALDAPYTGAAAAGYEMGEVTLGTLGPNSYWADVARTVDYFPPPPGTRYAVLFLKEWNGSQYVIRDYNNASGPTTFGDYTLDLSASWSWESWWDSSGNDWVDIAADSVANNHPSWTSGSLRLELWALASAYYPGSTATGYKLGAANLGTLRPGYYFPDIYRTVAFYPPPPGRWHTVLFLEEWDGSHYVIRDYSNADGPTDFWAESASATAPAASGTSSDETPAGTPPSGAEKAALTSPSASPVEGSDGTASESAQTVPLTFSGSPDAAAR